MKQSLAGAWRSGWGVAADRKSVAAGGCDTLQVLLGGWAETTPCKRVIQETSRWLLMQAADVRTLLLEPYTPKKYSYICKCRCEPHEVAHAAFRLQRAGGQGYGPYVGSDGEETGGGHAPPTHEDCVRQSPSIVSNAGPRDTIYSGGK